MSREGGTMTEAEWLACDDAGELIWHVENTASKRKRKLRLLAVALCARVGRLMTDKRSLNAVEVAERFADANATLSELAASFAEAHAAVDEIESSLRDANGDVNVNAESAAACAAQCTANPDFLPTHEPTFLSAPVASVGIWARMAAGSDLNQRTGGKTDWKVGELMESHAQVALLRCIFGNPFRPVRVAPSWLTWNGGTVPKLAQAIYDERRFADLPILADALEEAGCTDAAILDHCRQLGEHVRGCWVVDLCLGKK